MVRISLGLLIVGLAAACGDVGREKAQFAPTTLDQSSDVKAAGVPPTETTDTVAQGTNYPALRAPKYAQCNKATQEVLSQTLAVDQDFLKLEFICPALAENINDAKGVTLKVFQANAQGGFSFVAEVRDEAKAVAMREEILTFSGLTVELSLGDGSYSFLLCDSANQANCSMPSAAPTQQLPSSTNSIPDVSDIPPPPTEAPSFPGPTGIIGMGRFDVKGGHVISQHGAIGVLSH